MVMVTRSVVMTMLQLSSTLLWLSSPLSCIPCVQPAFQFWVACLNCSFCVLKSHSSCSVLYLEFLWEDICNLWLIYGKFELVDAKIALVDLARKIELWSNCFLVHTWWMTPHDSCMYFNKKTAQRCRCEVDNLFVTSYHFNNEQNFNRLHYIR